MLMLRMVLFSPISEPGGSDTIKGNQKKKIDYDVKQYCSEISQDSAPTENARKIGNSLNSNSSDDANYHRKGSSGDPVRLDTNEDWLMIYPRLSVSGLLRNVLSNIYLNNRKGRDYYFKLDEEVSTIYNSEMLPKLTATLSSFLDREAIVHVSIGQLNSETPSKLSLRLKHEAQKIMLESFEQDANVQKILNHFSGKITDNSITSLKEKI